MTIRLQDLLQSFPTLTHSKTSNPLLIVKVSRLSYASKWMVAGDFYNHERSELNFRFPSILHFMTAHDIIQWLVTEATLTDLNDIDSVLDARKKELTTTKPRGVLLFSDIYASPIDPHTNLPILTSSNIQAGFQYKLGDGQREAIEQSAGLQCTACVTILQVWVNPETNFVQEFELAANVAHTRTKGYVSRWICRDVTAFFAIAKRYEDAHNVEKEKKVYTKKPSTRDLVSKGLDKAQAQSLAAKYLTKK